ncbi:MAG: helix-turn-helix domain-containing protein [Candidatus Moraniibacteriota bacterium]
MNHLIEPLKNLGLSEKEVLVYLALLQLGSATPYQIAKKSGIKRPTAYVIAEDLVKKGLIVHVPGEEKKRYIAKSPEAFIEEREERLMAAKQILPELKSYQKNSAQKASIMYFEGFEGLKQAYQYREKELYNKEITGFFASNADATPEVNDFFLKWNDHREKHHIKARGVTVDTPLLKSFNRFINSDTGAVTAKFLPESLYSSKISIEACDDQFVRIFIYESVETLIVQSPKFTKAIKEIFELVWKSLEGKYDKPRSWEE